MPKPKSKPAAAVLTAAQIGVRDGETSALEAWAKEAEAAGDADTAKVIRDLPGLRDHIAEHLTEQRQTWPDVQVYLHHQEERSYWFLGDWDMGESTAAYPDRWPHLMGLLVLHWNRYYPGVEWLARELHFQHVMLEGSRPGVIKSFTSRFALHEGQHLTPLDPGVELGTIILTPSAPPKVAKPGDCPTCIGRGHVTCASCGGDAFVVVGDDERECKRCDLLGFYRCDACKGTGKGTESNAKSESKPAPKMKVKPTSKKKPKG